MNITFNPTYNSLNSRYKSLVKDNIDNNNNIEKAIQVSSSDYIYPSFNGRYKLIRPQFESPVIEKLNSTIRGFFDLPINSKLKTSSLHEIKGKDIKVSTEVLKSDKKTEYNIQIIENNLKNNAKKRINEINMKMILNKSGQMIGGSYTESSGNQISYERTGQFFKLKYNDAWYKQENTNKDLWMRISPSFFESNVLITKLDELFKDKEYYNFFMEMTKKNTSLIAKI